MIGHHLLAFDSTLAAVAGYQQLLAIADAQFSRQNNEYQIPNDVRILAGYAGGGAAVRAKLMTASLALRTNPQIVPLNFALLPPNDPNLMDFTDDPLPIKKEENLRAEIESNGIANNFMAAWIADPNHNLNVQYRPLRWIRGTAVVTTVANAWGTLGPIVLEENLEGGSYAVYGMQVFFATALAARLVFQNQYYRPGCLGQALGTSRSHDIFRGKLGLWGVFDTYSLPQLEPLDTAAAAVTYTVWLLVAKADGFQPPWRGQ